MITLERKQDVQRAYRESLNNLSTIMAATQPNKYLKLQTAYKLTFKKLDELVKPTAKKTCYYTTIGR